MARWTRGVRCVVFGAMLIVPASASAQPALIADVLASPSRHWNLTVTLVGQVLTVAANPAGTTRGTYTLRDESGPTPITVRSANLPPVGRTFSVVGVVIPDSASGVPVLKEVSRTAVSADAVSFAPPSGRASAPPAAPVKTLVADIYANPGRYLNRTVTVSGQVMSATAQPAGTTRGAYALRDDNGPTPIIVTTSDLPPVGKRFSVTGVVQQPPTLKAPMLKETARTSERK